MIKLLFRDFRDGMSSRFRGFFEQMTKKEYTLSAESFCTFYQEISTRTVGKKILRMGRQKTPLVFDNQGSFGSNVL
jgi:hypothetical protein